MTIDTLIEAIFSPRLMRWLLLAVVFSPLVFAVLSLVFRHRLRGVRRVAGFCSALHLGLTCFLVLPSAIIVDQYGKSSSHITFHPTAVPGDYGGAMNIGNSGGETHETTWSLFAVGKSQPGMPDPAVQLYLGLDGLNIWLILLSSLLCYCAVLCSWRLPSSAPGGYFAWLYVLQAFVTAAFASFDILLYYVFFELTLVPTFFLIGSWGIGGSRREAARKFFIYTLLGGLFTLVGIIAVVYTNPATVVSIANRGDAIHLHDVPRGPVTFNVNRLIINVENRLKSYDRWVVEADLAVAEKAWEKNANAARPDWKKADYEANASTAHEMRSAHQAAQVWIFFALIAGFVVKVPLVPFHTWLPTAYGEAPATITMLMSALLAKLGTLGMLRFVLPLCPDVAVEYGLPVFGTLGAIGIIYASLCAFGQRDIKLMFAYSSVAHLGMLVLGMFALNKEGLTGATLHMVNHGLTAAMTFLVVAMLETRYRSSDQYDYGGLIKPFPKLAVFTMIACLASVGLPGLNNFITEMLLLGGLFTPWNSGVMGYGLAVCGAVGIFLSAWYTFTMIRRVFFGPVKQPKLASDGTATPQADLSNREFLAFLLPTLCVVALGLFPQPVLNTMQGDIEVIQRRLDAARSRINPALAARETPPAVMSEADQKRVDAMRGAAPK